MKKKYKTYAAIHLGSEIISMQIIEYQNLETTKIIEQLSHRVKLGEETFKNKRIPFSMVSEICELLKGCKSLMDAYGVEEYDVSATTAVREAENQAYFLEQVFVKTGLRVDVVDMPREIYTKFVAIQRTLAQENIKSTEGGVLLVDISSGGLGITFVRDGQIKYQQNLHIGIIRIKEDFDRNQRSNASFNKALTQYISSTIGHVLKELEQENVKYLILSGTETELVLKMVGRDSSKNLLERMQATDFIAFYDKIRTLNLIQIIKIFHIEETSAELVFPTIILYQQLLALVPAQEIIIAPDKFIDGMKLLHIAKQTSPSYIEGLQVELMSLVHCIGIHYHYDYQHVRQVEKLALAIFDRLSKTNGLSAHNRLLLQAACILHDIGKFNCLRSHSLYSYQLIMASDMLGFSDQDKLIIALTAYYHSHVLFEKQEEGGPQVPRELLPLVAKLAAILRLADAMDRSYMQKILNCRVSIKGEEMRIQVFSKNDLSLEEWTFVNKGNFFVEVYGLTPILERVSEWVK
ncbi:MAG: HD domain-containing protein [Acidaminococcaceae bacterium]